MSATVSTVLRKEHDGPGTVVTGTPYPELAAIVVAMQAEDPTIIFDSLRPMGDEFWNMIDGTRSVGDIAEAVCLEFGFELSPQRFLPLVDGLINSGSVTVVGEAAAAK